MPRGIWSGAISFGLINIPVVVLTAKQQERLSFRMLDKRDHSPIGYRQINKTTGKEVDRKDIVKGYEYQKNQFVIITDQDFKKANPKATQTIDIEDFVALDDLDPLLFDTPYYLVPGKNGEKGYVLLRSVLEKTKRAAVGQFVIRNKQHLVAMMTRGDYIILETLRYAHEIREVKEAKFLEDIDLEKIRISAKEIKMAESLVADMTTKWNPEKYKDTYQTDLRKRIEAKIKSGETEAAPETEEAPAPTNTNVTDLMPLLERSLRSKGRAKPAARRKS
ncbi:MAG TPA: Ku protein, partial [Bdellovibrionales bacterium]|nr:Ku protein [Bdellovibrionales bacterium]